MIMYRALEVAALVAQKPTNKKINLSVSQKMVGS